MTVINGERVPLQKAMDRAYMFLRSNYPAQAYIWDLGVVRRWGLAPATEKQISLIRRKCSGFVFSSLNKMQASSLLSIRYANSARKWTR